MTRPRSQLISLEATPYYHCISRCVRRAFLCGKDRYSKRCFDHRKPWLVERLALLTSVFAIDVAAYAVMSNHYHLVLHIDKIRAEAWSDTEVIKRWTTLYKGPEYIQRWQAGEKGDVVNQALVKRFIESARTKLSSISRFMACLNEYMARKANNEDGCTGRFWEGRFKSLALLDEAALLSCMVYVDLNPVRAGITKTLSSSDYTSIQARIEKVQLRNNPSRRADSFKPRLMPFRERLRQKDKFEVIPYNLKDYIALTEWTGKAARLDKRGKIDHATPTLINTLGLSEAQWQCLALDIQKESISMLNGLDMLLVVEKRDAKIKAA